MGQRKKVLIINNEEDLCLLMKAYFLKKGYQVAIAHTLDAAFRSIEVDKPNIIFLYKGVCDQLDGDTKKLKEAAPDVELIVTKLEKDQYLF